MAAIYGGEEVNAVVVDLGTHTCKAGFAGDDTPKTVFASVTGVVPRSADANGAGAPSTSGRSSRDVFVGSTGINFPRSDMEIVSPFGADDLITDWDMAERLWMHALRDRLKIEPKENAILMSEPAHVTPALRERCVQALFEGAGCPALFLARDAVLGTFAMGRQSALMVDMGHRATTVVAVHDGYTLQKTLARSPLGGALLNTALRSTIETKNVTIRPRHTFKRVEKSPGVFEVQPVQQADTTSSFTAYQVETIVADVKEAACRVSEPTYDAQAVAALPSISYELPDGTEIQVGAEQAKVPEALFQPQLLRSFPGSLSSPATTFGGLPLEEVLPLQQVVFDTLGKCDVDIRRDLGISVLLGGGSSQLPGVRERLEAEVQTLAPNGMKIKAISAANSIERKFSTWIGGSILASLGSFQQMWMSKQEYQEHGAGLIHKKSP